MKAQTSKTRDAARNPAVRRQNRSRTGGLAQRPSVWDGCFSFPPLTHDLNPLEAPISVRLRGILQFKVITRLGALHGLPLAELASLRNCGRTTVTEFLQLVERAAENWIIVPPGVRGMTVSEWPVSDSLRAALASQGIQRLGDLHGLPIGRFYEQFKWPKRSVRELQRRIRELSGDKEEVVPEPPSCFLVPRGQRDLNPLELPMSVRLERSLRSLGVQRLGDLHGVPFQNILDIPKCGPRTFRELVDLLDRVAAGHFQAGSGAFQTSDLSALLRSLENLLQQISPRDREILILRLNPESGRAALLGMVGARFGLSKERIRQITGRSLRLLRRAGGPGLLAQLRGVAEKCREANCRLTPEVLADWLQGRPVSGELPLAVFARLLAGLNPEIPAGRNSGPPGPGGNARSHGKK